MKKRPIIGISTGLRNDNSNGFEGSQRMCASRDYVDAVVKAGAVPILIALNNDNEVIKAQIDMIDGLLLSGGGDIVPQKYGEEPHPLLGTTDPERDEFEFSLLNQAMQKEIPILAICRGIQLVNVYEGGSLYQDVSLMQGETIRHWQKEKRYIGTHKVKITQDSILGEIYPEEILVNSYHHQILKDVAPCFKVTARSSDGVVEAIEHREYRFLLGLQWHPEMMQAKSDEALKVFQLFVDKILENK